MSRGSIPERDDREQARVCARALEAARASLGALDAIREDEALPAARDVQMGIALHLGTPLYGNIGARRRLDFTVIGASVNEVCRLEPLTKELAVPIVVSERFVRACDAVAFEPLGVQELRGISRSVAVYTPS